MRHRILAELEKAAAREAGGPDQLDGGEEFSMEALAAQALHRSGERGWNLIDLPAQLRISTIDSFCRELALQQPLLSGLGGALDIFDDPQQLYRRAARQTLEQIDEAEPRLRAALERLLLWRDNGWQEMENLLVQMLSSATAGCTILCSSTSRTGTNCAAAWNGRLQEPCVGIWWR